MSAVAERIAEILADIRGRDLASAQGRCAALLAQAPNDPAVYQIAALLALERDQPSEAEAFANTSLKGRPDHPPTLVLAGRAARRLGKLAEAVGYFREAWRLAPARHEALFQFCETLLEGRDPQAGEMLNLCLKVFPENSEGWAGIGAALERAGQKEAAAAAYARALRNASSGAPFVLHMRHGRLLNELGRWSEAVEAFAAATALDGDAADAALQLGLARRRAGDSAGARTALARAAQLDTKSARAQFALGLACEDERDAPAAAAAYRRALEIDPHFVEAAVNLGVALQGAGDLANARRAYAQALSINAQAFGRIAQALAAAPSGELWLDLDALRQSLSA